MRPFGGGLRMGQVIGETDSRAERPRSGSISFQNLIATIYHVLGIDPSSAFRRDSPGIGPRLPVYPAILRSGCGRDFFDRCGPRTAAPNGRVSS